MFASWETVVNLTLIDLPGLTKVAVGMIFFYLFFGFPFHYYLLVV